MELPLHQKFQPMVQIFQIILIKTTATYGCWKWQQKDDRRRKRSWAGPTSGLKLFSTLETSSITYMIHRWSPRQTATYVMTTIPYTHHIINWITPDRKPSPKQNVPKLLDYITGPTPSNSFSSNWKSQARSHDSRDEQLNWLSKQCI